MVPPLIRTSTAWFFSFIVSCSVFLPAGYADDRNTVRVKILENTVMVRLSLEGYYSVVDAATHKTLFTGKDLKGVVTSYKNKVSVDGRQFKQERLVFRVDNRDALAVNNRKYSGDLVIIRKGSAMDLVNYLPLEDYIKGIAVREVSHYWPAAVLRAQAVVFRTYALYAMKQNASRDQDVTSDVYSQVYGGASAQRYRITEAVDDTAGDVLTYNGKIFPAFYHSTCGGHTESASALWDISLEPLKGVECFYCKGSPHYSWKTSMPLAKVIARLDKAGVKAAGLTDILILGTDPSGRITDLSLKVPNGQIKISAKDFRNILGPDIVRSASFDLSVRNKILDISGIGWGHGVGMCQWGAYFMAKAGFSHEEILAFYYPGSKISNFHKDKIER
jgi:stage II sporulation protein D